MFSPKRPVAGPLILLVAASALALSTLACAKKETVDSWQMQAPVLEMKSSGGERLQLRASEVIKADGSLRSLFGDEVASLQFAPADRGLALAVKSRCESDNGNSASFAETLKTAEAVSLISLVPPQTLMPEGLKQNWSCAFKLRVTNAAGSSHDFAFQSVKMNFSTSLSTAVPLDAETDSLRPKTAIKRRLICSTWWTDSSDADLATMSRVEKVNGIDSRTSDRQPLCSVIELASRARLVGFYRPVFAGPAITWNREILISNGELPALFHQPLIVWNIRNKAASTQTFFVATRHARVRLSGLFIMNTQDARRFWSRPTLAQPVLTVEGALDVKNSEEGFYFRVAGGANAQLTMSSGRNANIYSRFDFSRTTSAILMTTEQPILLQTLSNGSQLTSLSVASTASLDASPRDPIREGQDALLGHLVLKGVSGSPVLSETRGSVSEALRWGLPMEFAGCFVDVYPTGVVTE